MNTKMKIKVLKKFPSPLDNRMLSVGQEISVPQSQFWLKRIEQKDCEKVILKEKKAKAKSVKPEKKADAENKLKGSK